MIRVFVLENEEESQKALTKVIQNTSDELTVYAAADLDEARLLLYDTISFDLFFLDIHLNDDCAEDRSGLQFAEEVRSMPQYVFTPIVMVTSIAGMEIDAYRRLHCYQYVIKPYEAEEVKHIVQKVMLKVTADTKPSLIVKKNGINYKIFCSDIRFIKAIPRGVCIYLKQERMEIPYLTIRQLLEKLPEHTFFQCHRMYVVNREYVRYFDLVNQFIQVEGYNEKIEIGVTFKPLVRRMAHD